VGTKDLGRKKQEALDKRTVGTAFMGLSILHCFQALLEMVLIGRAAAAISPAEDPIRQTETIKRPILRPQYGSDLSPIVAEYGPISACSTQNKAQRGQ
jgi:hypothetical protein